MNPTRKYKQIIGVADIHGCVSLLKRLVEKEIRFNPEEDQLTFLGDFIDFRDLTKAVNRAGVSSARVVKYVSGLKKSYPENIILLKGNHELLAEQALKSNDPMSRYMWKLNGGDETIKSFGGLKKTKEVLLPFIKSLKLYHEIPEAIFVHGNIPYGKTLQTATEDELLWDRGAYRGKKLLIVGHSPVQEVTRIGNKICVDIGAFMTGKLSAYDVLNDNTFEAIEENRQDLFGEEFNV